MARVAGARHDGQVRPLGAGGGHHRLDGAGLVEGDDQRPGGVDAAAAQEVGIGRIAEIDRVAEAALVGDPGGIHVEGDVGHLVASQHLGDEPADPAVAATITRPGWRSAGGGSARARPREVRSIRRPRRRASAARPGIITIVAVVTTSAAWPRSSGHEAGGERAADEHEGELAPGPEQEGGFEATARAGATPFRSRRSPRP